MGDDDGIPDLDFVDAFDMNAGEDSAPGLPSEPSAEGRGKGSKSGKGCKKIMLKYDARNKKRKVQDGKKYKPVHGKYEDMALFPLGS